jgi:hypothetical protein
MWKRKDEVVLASSGGGIIRIDNGWQAIGIDKRYFDNFIWFCLNERNIYSSKEFILSSKEKKNNKHFMRHLWWMRESDLLDR